VIEKKKNLMGQRHRERTAAGPGASSDQFDLKQRKCGPRIMTLGREIELFRNTAAEKICRSRRLSILGRNEFVRPHWAT